MTLPGASLLQQVTSREAGDWPAFAVLRRPGVPSGHCEVLVGELVEAPTMAALKPSRGERIIAAIPFHQVRERGFEAVADQTPLRALKVATSELVPLATLRDYAQDAPTLEVGDFDIDDASYAQRVRDVQAMAIAAGEGANFVLSRTLHGSLVGFTPPDLVGLVARLLFHERGAYWTFGIHLGATSLVGASPELHIRADGGTVSMTPISGTLALPSGTLDDERLDSFLTDVKEVDELVMVLDEEVKMMSGICESPVAITGPTLRRMSRLLHTEYTISGSTRLGIEEVLARSLLAPTVTGSPLQNACRVIARHEPEPRGYYAGVLADLYGGDHSRPESLDSAIVIRTAIVDPAGGVAVRVGGTVVRLSDPQAEAAETRAKAAGLVAALTADALPSSAADEGTVGRTPTRTAPVRLDVAKRLADRNAHLSTAWLHGTRDDSRHLIGVDVLLLDCEDEFTRMLEILLQQEGARVTVTPVTRAPDADGFDLVVLGPGPGDPTGSDPRIAVMAAMADRCLQSSIPIVAVCLGHQVLASRLGLALRRRSQPHQGVQLSITVDGTTELCGFYNSFAAWSDSDWILAPNARGGVVVSRDPATGEVHCLRGAGFVSYQFHPESVLTHRGNDLLVAACESAMSLRVPATWLPSPWRVDRPA